MWVSSSRIIYVYTNYISGNFPLFSFIFSKYEEKLIGFHRKVKYSLDYSYILKNTNWSELDSSLLSDEISSVDASNGTNEEDDEESDEETGYDEIIDEEAIEESEDDVMIEEDENETVSEDDVDMEDLNDTNKDSGVYSNSLNGKSNESEEGKNFQINFSDAT